MTDPPVPPPVNSAEMTELHEALGSLRREIVERFPATEPEASLLADVDWEALFDGVRRRLSSIGMRTFFLILPMAVKKAFGRL